MWRRMLGPLFAVVLSLCLTNWNAPRPAQAHEGPPRLELNSERLNPGTTLEVRGVNIASEVSIMVVLVKEEKLIPLGEVVGDEHGDFTQAFLLPVDLETGSYLVQANEIGSIIPMVVSVPLAISGMAPPQEGEGEQRDQDEPLLAPMPEPQTESSGTGATIVANPSASVSAASSAKPATNMATLPVIALGLLALLLVIVAVVIRFTLLHKEV